MKELRMCVFQDAEVVNALIRFKQKTRSQLPAGTIAGLEKSEQPDVRLVMKIVADDGEKHGVVFHAAEVTAALVNYCLERNIRLPKGAGKSVTLIGNDVVLGMDISHMAATAEPKAKKAAP